MLSQVVELIESKRRFAITSHARPDGDSLGSSLGLFWLLRALGKEPTIIMRDAVPPAYRQLPGASQIRIADRIEEDYEAVFVIECSDITRPGLIQLEKEFVVNIDHHATTALFGSINWIDSTASAVGEMIYNLCKAVGVRPTREIAECVYVALITDTGSFHYSNTTERTFKIASELVRAGVRPAKIAQSVFHSHPWSKLELLGQVLSTAQRDQSGRVAWMYQTREMMQQCGANEEDADNFVNYPLSVGQIEAVAFLKECSPGVYRTSLRSKGDVNIARVAERFGGGGHRNAAGCTVTGAREEAESELIPLLVEAVEHASNGYISHRDFNAGDDSATITPPKKFDTHIETTNAER
jgi:bifunctional oligoribonuclease and PAP phosphatase NrnA